MKFTEKEIQNYIWEHKDNFWDMVQEPSFEVKPKKAPESFEPWELLYYKTLEDYKHYYESLQTLVLFGCEVSLPKQNASTIRADFLGKFDGENGLVVCELKVSAAPERQAYTEMLAYANHVRSSFAPMGRCDIFYLLISPMEERIVKEATLNTLVYDHNRVVALIPEIGDTLDSLQFKLWIPSRNDFKLFSKTAFAFENIDTFKVCWRGIGKWSPSEKGADPTEEMIHQLNQVSSYAAQLMEAKGINGFVFCSQSFPGIRDAGFLENSITICGINPYKAAKTKFYYEHGVSLKEAAQADIQYISIFNVFPSLKKQCTVENEKYNYWSEMSDVWSSIIDEIAFDVQERLTQQLGTSFVERDRGGMDWEAYLNHSGEDVGCWNYDIRLTGIMREIYDLYNQNIYDFAKGCSSDVVDFISDEYDVSEYYINMLNDQYYVRNFIRKLVDDGKNDYCENPKDKDELIAHPIEPLDFGPTERDM